MRFLMVSQRFPVNLRRSLNCRLDIIFGNEDLYCANWINRSFSLSMLIVSAVRLKAITSRSENLGITPRLLIFPVSLTRFPEKDLHISRYFANIAYKLYIR